MSSLAIPPSTNSLGAVVAEQPQSVITQKSERAIANWAKFTQLMKQQKVANFVNEERATRKAMEKAAACISPAGREALATMRHNCDPFSSRTLVPAHGAHVVHQEYTLRDPSIFGRFPQTSIPRPLIVPIHANVETAFMRMGRGCSQLNGVKVLTSMDPRVANLALAVRRCGGSLRFTDSHTGMMVRVHVKRILVTKA